MKTKVNMTVGSQTASVTLDDAEAKATYDAWKTVKTCLAEHKPTPEGLRLFVMLTDPASNTLTLCLSDVSMMVLEPQEGLLSTPLTGIVVPR